MTTEDAAFKASLQRKAPYLLVAAVALFSLRNIPSPEVLLSAVPNLPEHNQSTPGQTGFRRMGTCGSSLRQAAKSV